MKTEPLNVNQLKALDKGLERSEPVKKEPIKLTFYCGKLWNSEKPFPVKPKTNASVLEDKYLLEVRSWLSTAYEVVNPEVIPEAMKKGYVFEKGTILKYKHDEYEPMEDGDELTLPDNYIVSLSRNKSGIIATIVGPPDQPDNSAHGYTEVSEHCEGVNCPFEYSCKDGCMYTKNKPVVEPSESQEEIAGIVTKGNFIDLTTVAEQAHSEGKKEGWNEALDALKKHYEGEIENARRYRTHPEMLTVRYSDIFEELKRLKR